MLLTSAYAWEEARRNHGGPDQLVRLEAAGKIVTVVSEAPATLPCPLSLADKDRPVLLTALQAGATHFLTGDRRHFGAFYGKAVGGMLICSPADFLCVVPPQTHT
ncbi:MAG: hypothetical protein Q8P31_06040 [Bacillota bacterium]|nr:hypothetical protein [Bacillota bacterium]